MNKCDLCKKETKNPTGVCLQCQDYSLVEESNLNSSLSSYLTSREHFTHEWDETPGEYRKRVLKANMES